MPRVDIKLAPGIYSDETARGAKGRWKDGDLVRFRRGLVQPIGGWQKELSGLIGVARSMTSWQTLIFQNVLAIGTHKKLYLRYGGNLYNITPLRDSTAAPFSSPALVNPFTTTIGSAIVTVAHTGHGENTGDRVFFSGATAVGGITINGEYEIASVPTANTYTIVHSVAATSSATGGGTVSYDYEIHVGAEHHTRGLGAGAGPVGDGTVGTPRSASSIFINAQIWALEAWGEDLIASPRGGSIYWWDATNGFTTRAKVISQAPITAERIIVSDEDRHLIALGAYDGAISDRLLVRWCSQEDFTVWTALSTNTAGRQRVDRGTKLVTGIHTRRETVLFTDAAMYSMTFIGPPDTFGFRLIADTISIMGPNAAVNYGDITYIMAKNSFYVYDGILREMPCDVWTRVFRDINIDQADKAFAATSQQFSEIWWFYASAASIEIDRYVIYNKEENHWSTGALSRTAFHDDRSIFNTPFATSGDSLYAHEQGVNADGAFLPAFLESYDIELGTDDGEGFVRMHLLIPDFKSLTGSVDVSLKTRRFPQDAKQYTYGPKVVTATTKQVGARTRGSQIALRVASRAIGDFWQMGVFRADFRRHGKK